MKLNKTCVYYHGLGGCPDEGTKMLLNKHGFYVMAEHFDYVREWRKDRGKSMFERQLRKVQNIDLIVGLSFGGYLAYVLSKATGNNLLLFNPAVNRKRSQTGIGEFNIPKYSEQSRIEVFFGENDRAVPKEYTLEFFKQTGENFNAYVVKNMEHCYSINHLDLMLKSSKLVNADKDLLRNKTLKIN